MRNDETTTFQRAGSDEFERAENTDVVRPGSRWRAPKRANGFYSVDSSQHTDDYRAIFQAIAVGVAEEGSHQDQVVTSLYRHAFKMFGKLPFAGRHFIRRSMLGVRDARTPVERRRKMAGFTPLMAGMITAHALQTGIGIGHASPHIDRFTQHPTFSNGAIALYDVLYTAANAGATLAQTDITARTTSYYVRNRNKVFTHPAPQRQEASVQVMGRDTALTLAGQLPTVLGF